MARRRRTVRSNRFDSLTHETMTVSELATRVASLPNYFATRNDWNATINNISGACEWFGNLSLEDAVDAFCNGWKDAPAVDCMTLPDVAGDVETENYYRDVAGSILDVAAFVSGDPDCWLYAETETESNCELIRISAETGGHFGVSATELMNRANAIVALVHSLELSGKAVHLTVTRGYYITGGSTPYSYEFVVKDFGDALNINRLQFMLSPAFFRRCLFGLQEQFHGANISSSTGSHVPEGSDIHIDHKVGLCDTLDPAMAQVKANALSQLAETD